MSRHSVHLFLWFGSLFQTGIETEEVSLSILCITQYSLRKGQQTQHRDVKRRQTNAWRNPDWENVDSKKKDVLSKSTQKNKNKKIKKRQALLAGRHIETNAIHHSGCLLGEWAYQKSLLITKVLQETITHMDGDDTAEKTERNTEFMYTTSRTYQRTWSVRSCYEPLGWQQTWHSLVCTEIPSTNKACRSEFSVRHIRWTPIFKPFCTGTLNWNFIKKKKKWIIIKKKPCLAISWEKYGSQWVCQ